MNNSRKSKAVKRYTTIPQITPLPSQLNCQKQTSYKHEAATHSISQNQTQPVRAINEDDDGYDPYSDYRETPQMFEKDPWR